MNHNKKPLLVSACLLGENVRYDGKNCLISSFDISKLKSKFHIIPVCPETLGGLPTPRNPCEISGSANGVIQGKEKVLEANGTNRSKEFISGGKSALDTAKAHGVTLALLKAKSPSCGNNEIYNGKFNGELVKGRGVTAELLEHNNIKVFNENEIDKLLSNSY